MVKFISPCSAFFIRIQVFLAPILINDFLSLLSSMITTVPAHFSYTPNTHILTTSHLSFNSSTFHSSRGKVVTPRSFFTLDLPAFSSTPFVRRAKRFNYKMAIVIDHRLLALTAIVTIGFQFTFFLITYFLRFDKVTDFAGTTNFLLLAILTLTIGGGYNPRQIVVTTCVLVWGIRLCAFLLYRILLWGEDRRFDDKRNNLPRLAFFWILQAIWVWTVSLPTTILNSKPYTSPLNALDYVGWILFFFGLVLEATADQQKLIYKQSEASRGRWTDVGVWSWSRHPNFFGEMIVWTGLYLSAVNDLRGAEHIAVISPIFIILLLMFVSGIPILEKSADERYAHKEEYVEYKSRTSVLIMFPPSLYVKLPESLKKTLLLDFKLYNPGPKSEENVENIATNPTEDTSLVNNGEKKAADDNSQV